MVVLKVTNTKTGKTWTDRNEPHSWSELCLAIMEEHKDFNLIWCDIECLAKGNTWVDENGKWVVKEAWYMLDECGRYEPMPDEYTIEEVIGEEDGKIRKI